MFKKLIGGAAAALVVAGGLSAYKLAYADGSGPVDPSRPDCPGQIVCPLTGELVCRDRCPAVSATPADEAVPCCCCPGKN